MTNVKNMTMHQFVPNLDMTYKTIKCVREVIWTELSAKEVGELPVTLYGKMGWGRSLAHDHGCCNINVWRFSNI